MSVWPARLNAAIAWLFIAGSVCFVLGSVPAYVNAVGGPVDGVTYFVGSIFFTGASFAQLVQAQSPATTDVEGAQHEGRASVRFWNWLPRDRNWLAAATQFPGTLCFNISTLAALAHNATAAQERRYVWRPDVLGSILFLVSSAIAILAISELHLVGHRTRPLPWRIAWLNMVGSVLFMASALASYVLLSTDEMVSTRVVVMGTLLGAVCFLAGAILMFPAWSQAHGATPQSVRPPHP
jgi:hypothetical protein